MSSGGAAAVIAALKDEARNLLSSTLGVKQLVALEVGALGFFPYVYENPANPTQLNPKTYDWIKSALKAGASPVTQAGVFTNEYINALQSTAYSFSTADTAKLNGIHNKVTKQQAALLSVWMNSGFAMPPGAQPINEVLSIIQTTWAKPPTTLTNMRNSPNLTNLLSHGPASAQLVLPALSKYLAALGAGASLLNQSTMNNGYRSRALAAVQTPTAASGAMVLIDGTLVPAYPIATSQAAINAGLADKTSGFKLTGKVTSSSPSSYTVALQGHAPIVMPAAEFLDVAPGGDAGFMNQLIGTTTGADVTIEFDGVTLVSFGPAEFDAATGDEWMWMTPIRDSIKNRGNDVSGFKFSPNPGIDFSTSGPFGYLTNVAIANYPKVTITSETSSAQAVSAAVGVGAPNQSALLGVPLPTASPGYAISSHVDAAAQTVSVTLAPSAIAGAANSLDSTAWVLGVVGQYPAA